MNLSPLPFLEERTHTMTNLRIGHGYDVHRMQAGRRLVLGAEDIPCERGLLGHSDADVLVHAVMDALLGAAGLEDIGSLFPDSSEEFRGISSLVLLERVAGELAKRSVTVVNVDATVLAQAPKLAPYPTEVGTAMTGFCTRPPMTLASAPSMPATATTQLARWIGSRLPSRRCSPLTPTS